MKQNFSLFCIIHFTEHSDFATLKTNYGDEIHALQRPVTDKWSIKTKFLQSAVNQIAKGPVGV